MMRDSRSIVVRRSAALIDMARPRTWFEAGFKFEERDISSLKEDRRSLRKHSVKQIDKVAASIATFGFYNPIIVDQNGSVVSGHGRYKAAIRLGMKTVPVIVVTHLTDDQLRLLAIADNRVAQLSGWDEDLLRLELSELSKLEFDVSLEITGFDEVEIENLILGTNAEIDERDEALPDAGLVLRPVTVLGDLWELDGHRLLCGDSLKLDSYERLLRGEVARIVFGDAPYNCRVNGHAGGLGKIQHREFAMASGEMSDVEFDTFLRSVIEHIIRFTIDGALIYLSMDWRNIERLARIGREADLELKNLAVWAKTNAGMGSLYRSAHELVFVFKNGTAPHINNVELGKHGRYRTNVWHHPGSNKLRRGQFDTLAGHPTVKPVELVADCLRDASRRGDVVLDPFCGSGTTIIAAAKTGRQAYCIELDPIYVDTAIRRWQAWSGKQARHAATGRTFDETERARQRTRDRSRTWGANND